MADENKIRVDNSIKIMAYASVLSLVVPNPKEVYLVEHESDIPKPQLFTRLGILDPLIGWGNLFQFR